MMARYEYWQHRLVGLIVAVKLDGARVVGACGPIKPADVSVKALPGYRYRRDMAADVVNMQDSWVALKPAG